MVNSSESDDHSDMSDHDPIPAHILSFEEFFDQVLDEIILNAYNVLFEMLLNYIDNETWGNLLDELFEIIEEQEDDSDDDSEDADVEELVYSLIYDQYILYIMENVDYNEEDQTWSSVLPMWDFDASTEYDSDDSDL